MENTFFITLLVSLIAVVIVLYFFKKQNAHISQSINYQANVKTDRKINDFIFANNLQRNNYIVELLKIHDLTIITWFDDEKKQLKNLLDNSIFKANIFLHTQFSSREVNSETPLVLWGHPPLANMEDEIALKTNIFSIVTIMSSLDDALLQYFVSNKTRKFLDSLGYRDGEVLENTMISKSIRMAQEELQKTIKNPKSATSDKEWFQLNVLDNNQMRQK
jgi:hypothetical protein